MPQPVVPQPATQRTVLDRLLLVAALLLINGALTFDNLWPTPAIKPALALSLECLVLVAVAALAARLGSRGRARLLAAAALACTLLVFSRYAEVTMPAMFGRPINLYWDGRHIPTLLALAWRETPWWQSLAIVAAVAALALTVHLLLRWALRRVSAGFADAARPAAAGGISAVAVALAAGSATLLVPAFGDLPVGEQHRLRDYVARPVSATWVRQTAFIATALSAQAVDRQLPPGPAFDGNVAALGGADLILVFLESYGAAAFDNPGYSRQLQQSRTALAEALAGSGRHVVSAFVRSPTFGGGSWLAHASLLSGIDVSDPGNYDLLLTTRRPTLVSHFHRQGYETVALMPGIRADWPEGSFYGYDALLDSRSLDYRGPEFGYWRIPDQYSIARFEAQRRASSTHRPRFLVFPTITSHIPFGPVPPYQPDWTRLVEATPYSDSMLAGSLGEPPDWLHLGPAYVRTLEYSFAWLAGYVAQPVAHDYMMILIGDHQPAASVSGRDASWDVPVHLITSDTALADRFVALGFTPGLVPFRPALGQMSRLTTLLLQALNLQ